MKSTDVAGEAQSPATPAAATTAGAFLRRAREKQGIHIAVLAATLKVSQRKLEAIEADRYQDLTDLTFARALAQAMCRALKIEVAPVLALLPAVGEPELERVSRGLNQPFRERATRDEGISLEVLKSPAVWLPVLIVAAAAAVYFVPAAWVDAVASLTAQSPAASASAPVASQSLPALPGNAASALIVLPAQAAASESVVTPTPASVPAASAVPQLAQARPGDVPLVIRTRTESWIEVTGSQGQVLLSRLLKGGEVVELPVQPPVKMRVGNVAGTEVSLRGAAVSLAVNANSNVAQLELK